MMVVSGDQAAEGWESSTALRVYVLDEFDARCDRLAQCLDHACRLRRDRWSLEQRLIRPRATLGEHLGHRDDLHALTAVDAACDAEHVGTT